jgi:hypothetical protein
MKRSLHILGHQICSLLPALALLALVVIIGGPARAAETNSSPGVSFESFRLISERNIFDPTRRRGYTRNNAGPFIRTPPSETFTLLGTMSSAQGTFAFFGGTSAQFRKTVKAGDTIANYRIAAIEHDYVKLAASSNQTITLPVQTQMRRQADGPWSIGGRGDVSAEPASASSGAAESKPTPSSATSGAVSDIMKRLMQKRAEEK